MRDSWYAGVKLLAIAVFLSTIVECSKRTEHVRVAVLTGLDVLQKSGFKVLEHSRVGLITNHTGVNHDGLSACRQVGNHTWASSCAIGCHLTESHR